MAAPKSGTGTSAKRVTKDFLVDLFQGALGGVMASVTQASLREAFSAAFTGKGDADDIPDDLRKKLREIAKDMAKKGGADNKLIDFEDDYILKAIAIRAAGKPPAEEQKELESLKKDFEAKVIRYQNEQLKKELPAIMKDLADLDAKVASGEKTRPPEIVGPRPSAERPLSYVKDFMRWVSYELTPAQKTMLMSRRDKIKTVSMITGMLDHSANPTVRFKFLEFMMGKLKITELGSELVESAMNGSLEDHPSVRGIVSRFSDRMTTAENFREMEDRCFANRRKV